MGTPVLLFARRDRVDLLRPTATNITIPEIKIPFETEPWGRTLPPGYVLSYDDAPPEPQLPDRYDNLRPFWEQQGGRPVAFKPSRFVKRPWCKEQLAQFDMLPILARLHRPQTAQFMKDGKPLGPKARNQAFLGAWEKALATLPKGQEPVRVIYDCGPKGDARIALLTLALHTAGPDLDVSGKDGLNITRRLGDTGANAPYVALALGILATQKQDDITAVVNLRREDRATVMMVSPPTAEEKVPRKIHLDSKYLGTSE